MNLSTRALAIGFLSSLVVSAQSVPGFATLADRGDPTKRIDILIVGDGYNSSEEHTFATDASVLTEGIFSQEPFRSYREYFNVHRLFRASTDSGVSHIEAPCTTPDVRKRTLLNTFYYSIGIQYCPGHGLSFNKNALNTLVAELSPYQRDYVIIIANDPQYGGTAHPTTDGLVAIVSKHSSSVDVVLHELGHSLGLLADEYEGGGVCEDGAEPDNPNVTRETDRLLIKWRAWIDSRTSIPTRAENNGVPGLYRGGRYCDSTRGLFRPTFNSKMRDFSRAFEQVNTEALITQFYLCSESGRSCVRPIDDVAPAEGTEIVVTKGNVRNFGVVPSRGGLEIGWFVDGRLVGQERTLLLETRSMSVGIHRVELVVADTTPRVRKRVPAMEDNRGWQVRIVDPAGNQPPTAGFLMTLFGQQRFGGSQLDAIVRTGSTARVQFDGSQPLSFDPDPGGTVTAWRWRVNGVVVASTSTFIRDFGVGQHSVELVVTDDKGQQSIPVVSTIQVNEAPPTTYARSMSVNRGGHSATLLPNQQVLVAGGLTPSGRTNSAELYDPQTDTWSPTTTPMAHAREGHMATLLTNGKVLIAGGYNVFSSQILKSAEIYDPETMSFMRVGDMAMERVFTWMFALSGGRAVAFSGGPSGRPVEVFSSETNTWSTMSTTPINVHTASQLPDGRIFLAQGEEFRGSVAIYDPVGNTWTLKEALSAPRRATASIALPDLRVWLFGGVSIVPPITNFPLTRTEVYEPNGLPDGRTIPGPALVGDLASGNLPGGGYLTSSLLSSGKVLLVGGAYSRALDRHPRAAIGVNLFDPVSGAATALLSLLTPRFLHTATVLPNGRVLIVGGHSGSITGNDADNLPVASTEIITPP